MTPDQLRAALRSGQPPALLLLFGEEGYLVERAARQVRDAVVAPADRDFNLTVVHGRELKGRELVDQARTLPVFASRRLVEVRYLHEAPADQLEALAAYLDNPVPETCLLLSATTIDKRRKFFQKFAKAGEMVEFKRLYDNQLPAFVRERAREAGRTFTEPALRLFCRRVGTNLAEVMGEFDKLTCYAGAGEFIEEEDVAAVVADTRVETVFALTDALAAGEAAVALRLLRRLLDGGQPGLVILTMIARHLRQVWKARELQGQGAAPAEVARRVGISPYFLDGLLAQARRYDDRRLRAAFPRLLEVDLALKSGGDEQAHLEGLIFALLEGAAPKSKGTAVAVPR